MSTLTIDVVTDAQAAASDLDAVASAARGAGDAVAAAGAQVDSAGADFDRLGEGADNVSSKSSQAAGAMGDLAGGLDLIGASGAATALDGIAIATQVAAGAGDVLNLVAETSVGRFVAQKVATVASTAATVANTVATKAAAAGQWLLNAALEANPIGLVVIALAALAAGIIYAYKHSETFRSIVDGAFSRAKDVIDAVVDSVQAVIKWFGDLPEKARSAWDAVREAIADKVNAAIEKVGDLVDKVTGGVSGIVSTVRGYFDSMFAPIQSAIGWVQDLLDKLSHVKLPDVNPFGRAAATGEGGGNGSIGGKYDRTSGGSPNYVSIDLRVDASGGTDPDATARRILDTLNRYGARVPGGVVIP